MKRKSGFLMRTLIACLFLPFLSILAATGEGVRARLLNDAQGPLAGGKSFLATVVLELDPGWHTYWKFPGDSGLPPSVTWVLPRGWTAGPLEFSIPRMFSEPGDMIVYGYERISLLRASITPSPDAAGDSVFELKAHISWLACKDLCVPGGAELSCKIPSSPASGMDAASRIPTELWPERGAPPFAVTVSENGGGRVLSFPPRSGGSYEFFPDPPQGTTSGHVTQTSSGREIVFSIPWDGPAPFQGLLVQTEGSARRAWWIEGNANHASVSGGGVATGVLLAALFSGFLGGLILNLMPCVLPVISLKIFGFIAQAGESPSRILRHGMAFAAGIFAWFLGLGILVVLLKSKGSQVTWGAFQFQNPYFVVGLSVLVFLFALNLFGVFEIILPGSAVTSLDRAASRGGYLGSFFQGLFATLLATPCTAPFLGSALGFAFAQSPAVILAMFFSVSSGMAFPYLLLSARPGWRRWIPKPGPWMERLKQFMGFPLLATNLWLLWVIQNQRGSLAVVLLLGLFLMLGFCGWIYGASSLKWRTLSLIVFGALVVASAWTTAGRIEGMSPVLLEESTGEGIPWIPYSASRLESLRMQGKPVLLDFTASWCLTCQFNERTAINVPAVRKLLREKGITPMKGDWTNEDPAITTAIKSFGRAGVPLVVYYPAGSGSQSVVLPELLTESLVLRVLNQ